ncbi:hypothetical protein O7632_26705 [Solwaraspora sp. WMMD406]|uniref:hypothetical protein n=1 Tax=Solwaraspora sp. WMMD406 TaxID=3016095 RepID=UPI002416D3B3|nr:hypothetical protein [Solwaraspora sp. WMMD406]MDG4767656.1 hypothetical protein [Solwaraspora sp. WMMD406]
MTNGFGGGGRTAARRRIPYVAVIGAWEAPYGRVALRLRDGRQLPAMPGADAVAIIASAVAIIASAVAHRSADLLPPDEALSRADEKDSRADEELAVSRRPSRGYG